MNTITISSGTPVLCLHCYVTFSGPGHECEDDMPTHPMGKKIKRPPRKPKK